MNCEEANHLIGARVDGELSPGDRTRLDEHVAGCAACRETADVTGTLDADLDRAFGRRRDRAAALAERVIVEMRRDAVAPRMETRSQATGWVRWGRPLTAAAAGFALAILLMRGMGYATGGGDRPTVQQDSRNTPVAATLPATRPAPVVGQLALATGAVFVCPQESQEWRPLASGGEVEAGMRVRTGPKVRCEFRMAEGSEVRLNAGTEVTLRSARRIDVAGGQVFSSVKPMDGGEAFVVRAEPAAATLTALGTAFDVACAPGGASAATLTVVEGSVRLAAREGESVVKGGEVLRVADGRLEDKRQVENLMRATQWVDEILVMKGRDNAELARRIDELFARLGHDKMWYMNAQEVRRLGDHCVVPLTRYIQSDRSRENADERSKRKEAARIIADVATTASIPELINLLADDDGDVRYAAARALQRLTGQNQGLRPEQWRDQSWAACAPSVEQWHGWWGQNKGRFPGADPDAVKPFEVVKQAPELKSKG